MAAEIAVHLEAGGALREAAAWRLAAAATAASRSADAEVILHAESGLRLLAEGAPGRDGEPGGRQEELRLDLELALGRALMAHRGWGAPEAEAAFGRADALCRERGDDRRRLLALWGIMAVTIVRGRLDECQAASEELLALARRLGSPIFELAAEMELGVLAFERGELRAAEERLARAEALYEPASHREHVERVGVDLGLFTRAFRTHLTWLRGDAAAARAAATAVVADASARTHPLTLALTLAYAAVLYAFLGDRQPAKEVAEEALAVCSEHGFPYYLEWARIVRGWASAEEGADAGLAEARQGVDTLRALGRQRLLLPFELLLAEALIERGRRQEAREAIARVRGSTAGSGFGPWRAELLRIEGELLASEGEEASAAAAFSRARDVAREQGARALERRAEAAVTRRAPRPHRGSP